MHKKARVLITGAHGFLGRHTALCFKKKGYEVLGIGHGHWEFGKPENFGIDQWIEATVGFPVLNTIKGELDCIVHCAGGGSVGYSVEHPLEDFEKTVTSSISILEYIRVKHPNSYFIYPSSAAVYGDVGRKPILESFHLDPVSPYGFHKKIVEELCSSYSRNYNLKISIIRFFSIYGEGLKKQLLWDACKKISSSSDYNIRFFGSGEETRDWIHVEDAAELLYASYLNAKANSIINGGSGNRVTNVRILKMLAESFLDEIKVGFIGQTKVGDPMHYWADISKAKQIGWKPRVSLEDGVKRYVKWYKTNASS